MFPTTSKDSKVLGKLEASQLLEKNKLMPSASAIKLAELDHLAIPA